MKPTYKSAKSAGELVGKILEPVLSRKAGMTLDLLVAWADIIGEPYGPVTRPEKIAWPRRAHDDEPFKPATLVIACEPAKALFVQHDQSMIVERVNRFFGFAAIARIKLVQKPITAKSQPAIGMIDRDCLSTEALQAIENELSHVTDDMLRERLIRIRKGMLLRNHKSPIA